MAGSGDVIAFHTDSDLATTNERMRIDSSGRLLVGTSSSYDSGRLLQVANTSADAGAEFLRFTASSSGAATSINLTRSRGTTLGTNTRVNSGDALGYIQFKGANGTGYNAAAFIYAEVDGTPGEDDMPGRLVFSTTADGASSPTERMRIDRDGNTTISCSSYSAINSSTTSSSVEVLRLTTAASNSSNNKIIQILASGGQGRGILYSGNSVSQAAYLAAASDRRIKTNIRQYTEGYEKIKLIPVKLYDEIDGKQNIPGWIADEVQQVIPSAVNGEPNAADEDGNPIYQTLGATNFIPDIVQALQAAIAKIETLEAKVAALEAQ